MPSCLIVIQALRRSIAGAAISFNLASVAAAGADIAPPVPRDSRLQIALVAVEPQIVTPIGIAVDQRNRLFVAESHTHHRPDHYKGPATDRVKVFLDSDKDGVPDQPKVFAEGFKSAMNLALSPANELYLVHRSGVVLLHDTDGDGVSERNTTIVKLVTTEEYPHNGLSGITFSADGWLYLGMGENFGAEHTLYGTDGTSVYTGPGRGGKIYRCRPDGSALSEVAAGFWNPFGLEVDRANRLFCVDNDPGGRPPCRLLHIVAGGDYGYKRRYDDTNVFNGWDGELPGTLPMVSGTGESPCGILSCDRLALPAAYAGGLLVASWGDAAIELYRLRPRGASFGATKELLLTGEKKFNEAFCPVDMAAAPDGSLYITDWANRSSYPVHGQGRIWRLSSKAGVPVVRPAHAEPLAKSKAESSLERLTAGASDVDYPGLKTALADPDPFIRAAAIGALAKPRHAEHFATASRDANPEVRLGALIAQWRSWPGDPVTILRRALEDEDERVRLAALWWAGEEGVTELSPELGRAVAQRPSPLLFQAYLTAAELLAASADATPQPNAKAPPAKTAPAVRQQLLERILQDDSQPAALHALAAASVTSVSDAKTTARLLHFARNGALTVRREAVRTLGACSDPAVPDTLISVALDTKLPAALRADAIVSLTRRDPSQLRNLTRLLHAPEAILQIETARALRMVAGDPAVRAALQEALASQSDPSHPLTHQLQFALQPGSGGTDAPKRPASKAEWKQALTAGGDAESGERIFLHPLTGCTACHKAQGRGATLGPDLSRVAQSLDRNALIDAILDPSREVAPQYEHHIVTTKAGAVYSGVLVHSALDGAPLMDALGAGRLRVPMAQVARHDTSPLSIMPAGLENLFTIQDFRDLLSYLQTLK